MTYVDGFVAAVPAENREAFIEHAKAIDAVFMEHGATRIVECWGDDVPDGKVTDFRTAVKAEEGETVVFSWIEWPSKDARDHAMKAAMDDPRMSNDANPMPFDGQRMIYGGFASVVELSA